MMRTAGIYNSWTQHLNNLFIITHNPSSSGRIVVQLNVDIRKPYVKYNILSVRDT